MTTSTITSNTHTTDEPEQNKEKRERERLTLIPVSLNTANTFVAYYHRHNKPVVGAKFTIGVVDSTGLMRGVAIIGRPVARLLDTGQTLEVTRVAHDGCPNAGSFLYGAARRITFALGYTRLVTYTLTSESGASLRGAGWQCITEIVPRSDTGWENRPGRVNQFATQAGKYRWETHAPLHNDPLHDITYPWDMLHVAHDYADAT